ncbi:MAG: 50S ribosomal protein L2 [Candidatus Heimdallarchaeota archaeon]|nr:50S ribosomal protein L2 [Candidatus Heimdallarchaeota archaeon]
MGKRILVQRRGRGGQQFRANTHKRRGAVKYPQLTLDDYKSKILTEYEVVDLLHDPGRGAPLMQVREASGRTHLLLAPEGIQKGQSIYKGPKAPIKIGSIMPLKNIPDGTYIYNIELRPGDGGAIVRASGAYATVISHSRKKVFCQLPSGELKQFNPRSRATIGVVAGGGRTEKPFLKAGAKYHHLRAKGRKYPRVRGVTMNAVSHPHGGGSGTKTVSRNAPPGAKVGLIAARQSGRKRGKK